MKRLTERELQTEGTACGKSWKSEAKYTQGIAIIMALWSIRVEE